MVLLLVQVAREACNKPFCFATLCGSTLNFKLKNFRNFGRKIDATVCVMSAKFSRKLVSLVLKP